MTDSPRDPLAETPRHAGDTHATLRDTSVDRTSNPPSPAPAGPAVIASRYRLERELGRGGAAIVWLARDQADERQVAVKILRAEVANTVASDRFLEEIRIVTELSHPRLLPILDSGEWDGLLYYVTPFVERGSLRARLDRERQLPVAEALSIVRDVADALEYAHQHGVIHRDIKPENILVEGDHALVADFGIARALTRAAGDRITSTGISVGTPAYMSPEQAAGNRDIDHRTDVYSLGCVLYEMIAGVTPFVGPTPESVIAQRFLHSPHPLRVYRPTVPPHVEAAVERAMAMGQADRFRTIAAFADALADSARVSEASVASRARRWSARRLVLGGAVVVALAAAVALGVSARSRRAADATAAQADSASWLVANVDVDGARTSPADAQRQLADALRRWRDLGVSSAPAGTNPKALAAKMHAGRVVVARLAAIGDSVELGASLVDAKGDTLRRYAARAPSGDAARVARLYAGASAALTADTPVASDEDWSAAHATDRASAWRAYSRARAALASWNLNAAIRDLRVAVARDPEYAPAQLWLAQALAWSQPDSVERWRSEAVRAKLLARRLSTEDSVLAVAVAHLAEERNPDACVAYRSLLPVDRLRTAAWLGLGQCQAMDRAVVRDRGSPSGWSFRGSYEAALMAYDSAMAHASGAPEFAFAQFGRLLFVDALRLREGRTTDADSALLFAHPSLLADTIAFVPWPAAELFASVPHTLPATMGVAIGRNVERLEPRLREWVRRAPASAEALSTLGMLQEMRGDYEHGDSGPLAAVETMRAAVRATQNADQRVRHSASVVRLLLKSEDFAGAHALADSLLIANPKPTAWQARFLVGVAVLIGDVTRGERLLSLASADPANRPDRTTPQPVLSAVARLTVHAALGACTPRLSSLLEEIEQTLERYVPPESRAIVRTRVLARPLSLAVPCLGPAVVDRIPDARGRVILAQRALAHGDPGAVRAQLDTLARMRRVERSGDVALDNTLLEASLLLALRDTAQAQHRICVPLAALSTLGQRLLMDAPQAAAVGRSFALCARIAAKRGDSSSAMRWRRAADALWSTADPALQAQLSELHAAVAQ